ncbi:hypothetical protein ACRN9F_13930 [Shewanella oncorhynchi]|uniref:hypothetical protein n=1 Tax=Shewanella oncorhynchi TaxID=2726434 RepID=UPI003D7AB563
MSYGLALYAQDRTIDITSGWYPMAFKGTIEFTVKYLSAADVVQDFVIPNGCRLFIQPAGAAVRHTSYVSFGSTVYTGYIVSSKCDGGRVTLSQSLWYGGADSPLNNSVVKFNVYAYYPVANVPDNYGILFADGGVAVALSNANRLNVERFKYTITNADREIDVSTAIASTEPPPSVYVSDTGYNAMASYVYSSGGYWRVKCLRAGGLYNVGSTYNDEPPRSGTVKIIAFGSPLQTLPSWGLAFYGDDGGVAFSSANPPEMPRGYLISPTPLANPPGSAGWHAIGDSNPQQFPNFATKKPMYQARLIGAAKLSFTPFPVGIWLKSDGTFTCGVLTKGAGSMPVGGSAFGYWGESSVNSPIPYIHEDDYF